MGKTKIEDIVAEMAEKVTSAMGLELVETEYLKEGGSWYLRIFIDKPEGIGHDDCQEVSKKLSDLLEEKDPIPHAYFLEVSSPGIERPLKKDGDFERFKGHKIKVNTFSPIDGKKEFVGELAGLENEKVAIIANGQTMTIPRELVAKARVVAEF